MSDEPFRPKPDRMRSTIRYAKQRLSGGPEYCFIVGCPRSGTTALTRLVHSHPDVVIGLERYRLLLRKLDGQKKLDEFGPSYFAPGRFFDFRPTDTNITPDHRLAGKHYTMAAERFSERTVRIVGDKVPSVETIVLALAHQFRDSRFIFVYRDLTAVASSYCRRARNPDDRWDPEHTAGWAAKDWHEAFVAADALRAEVGSERVFVVRYETLFSGDRPAFDALFTWLGAGIAPESVGAFDWMTAGWTDRADRSDELTDEDLMLIEEQKTIDQDLIRRYDALALEHVVPVEPPARAEMPSSVEPPSAV